MSGRTQKEQVGTRGGGVVNPQGKGRNDNGFLLYVRYEKESVPFTLLSQLSHPRASEKRKEESANATSTGVGEGKKKAMKMKYCYLQRQSRWINIIIDNNSTPKAIRIRANNSPTTYLQPLVYEAGDKEDKSYYHLLKLIMAGRSPKARHNDQMTTRSSALLAVTTRNCWCLGHFLELQMIPGELQ